MDFYVVRIFECDCGHQGMVREELRKGDVVVCEHCDRRHTVETLFRGNRMPHEDNEFEAEPFSMG